jgi:CheY-like chemotaxis protein
MKPSLLLVDDNPANLVALQAVLAREYNLVLAASGEEAVELVDKHDFSVILLDVQMPGIDGFETARLIKNIQSCRDIPIIFITAIYTEDPFVKKGYEAGAIDYFSKPFDPEILKLKVQIYSSFKQKATLLKEREKRILESEELLKAGRKLSAVLESLPVGVIIADVGGRIVQTNEEVLRLWHSIELVENDYYGRFLGWWDHDGQLIKNENGPIFRVLNSGQSTHNEILEITCFDETRKDILNSASPLRGRDGEIMGVVVVIQDVTEHRKIEQDLEDRILRLITLGVEFEQAAHH